MRRLLPLSALAMSLTLLAGCNASTLGALTAALTSPGPGAVDGPGAVPGSGTTATTAPSTSASTPASTSASATPATSATPNATGATSLDPELAAAIKVEVAAFTERLAADETDPYKVARLFIEGLCAYQRDEMLSRGLMALTLVPGEVREDPKSPTGINFVGSRDIYFRTIDRQPDIGKVYLDDPSNVNADDVASHVFFDEDYKALDKGVDEAAGTAYLFLKVTNPANPKASRPIRLRRTEGVWRVNEYNSLMVAL